jgi:hypothetical protein
MFLLRSPRQKGEKRFPLGKQIVHSAKTREEKQMAKNKRLDDIKNQLDRGIKKVMTSERFKEWFQFLSGFHTYSFNNTILIYLQKPNAKMVKGFNEWKKDGRIVKKGEKAIRILAPLIKKQKEEENTGDNERKKVLYRFRYVNVFDDSQTEGKEIPTLDVELLNGEGEHERVLLQEWIEKIEIPVVMKDIGEANGYFHLIEHYIAIHENRSTTQQLKTLIHEYAHYLLHAKGAKFEKEENRIREAQAEAVAYVVMN